MPTGLTHAMVGLGLAEVFLGPDQPPLVYGLGALLGLLPDIDVAGLYAGVPYGSFFGHRGFSHSLCAAALVSFLVAWATAGMLGISFGLLWSCFFIVTATHGLLDGCNDAGLGIAYFAPFDATRYFLPWRPIRTPYIGGSFFRHGPLEVLASEARWIWLPLAVLVGISVAARALA